MEKHNVVKNEEFSEQSPVFSREMVFNVHRLMDVGVHREHGLAQASAFDLLFALVQITYCVGKGVLAALDVGVQALKLVWRNDTTFLSHA